MIASERRMFPLGSVLLPHAPLPLHIFEQRYQQLLNDSLEDDRTFGVVLIERGSEVGGGEVRTDMGTLARIVEHRRLDDGRAAVIAVGVSRIEITEWLDDAPYPLALVADLPTRLASVDPATFARAEQILIELLNAAQRMGRIEQVSQFDWPDDIEVATWQLAASAPIALHDRQRVLRADTVHERLALLTETLTDMADDLRRLEQLDR